MIVVNIKGCELLDGEFMDDEDSQDEDSEEDNEEGEEGDVDLDIDDTIEPEAGNEIDPVFVSDLDALHRMNDAIQAEKANTSPALLPFFVSVGNALALARQTVRKRAAANQDIVDELVASAKKRKI